MRGFVEQDLVDTVVGSAADFVVLNNKSRDDGGESKMMFSYEKVRNTQRHHTSEIRLGIRKPLTYCFIGGIYRVTGQSFLQTPFCS